MSRVAAVQPIRTPIAVVADDEIPRLALVHLLNARPEYEVVSSSTVEVAEKRSWVSRPSVVVIHVQRHTGVIKLIEDLCASQIAVVILVPRHAVPVLQVCRRAGAIGFVVVEGNFTNLFSAINAAAIGQVFVCPVLSEMMLAISSGETASAELSVREQQVLTYVAYGYSNEQIGRKLALSRKTVETYRARVMDKLQFNNRADLVKYALTKGILSPGGLRDDLAS